MKHTPRRSPWSAGISGRLVSDDGAAACRGLEQAGIKAQKGSLRRGWQRCRCRRDHNRGRLLDGDLGRGVMHLGARETPGRRDASAGTY